MANRFYGRGNLGAIPELHYMTNEERTPICALRVRFDRRKPDGEGGFEDRGSFWMNVSYFGDRAQHVAELLRKGARVAVTGELIERSWEDQDGNPRSEICVTANHIDLDLARVEHIEWRPRATDTEAA
jgi:single-strand DNA-binding protein